MWVLPLNQPTGLAPFSLSQGTSVFLELGRRQPSREHSPSVEAGAGCPELEGHRDAAPGMSTSCLACLPRTLSGLSQTHSSQQHVGLSQTARLYPAPAASGQLTSNALPMGPGPERRDGAPQAAYLDHPSSSWGKDALSPVPHRSSFSPPLLPRFTVSERLSCHPVPLILSANEQLSSTCFVPGSRGPKPAVRETVPP